MHGPGPNHKLDGPLDGLRDLYLQSMVHPSGNAGLCENGGVRLAYLLSEFKRVLVSEVLL